MGSCSSSCHICPLKMFPIPLKKGSPWDFSGSPVVKTPSVQCRGFGFNVWLGNWDPTCFAAKNKILKNFKLKQKEVKTETRKSRICFNSLVHISVPEIILAICLLHVYFLSPLSLGHFCFVCPHSRCLICGGWLTKFHTNMIIKDEIMSNYFWTFQPLLSFLMIITNSA